MGVYLDGMWKDREAVKATRKEAKAAGLLQEDPEDEPAQRTVKKIEDQVATDPYIQVALHMLKESRGGGGTAGTQQ